MAVEGVPIRLTTLALRPAVFSIANLTSAEETAEMVAYATPRFRKSDVVRMDKDVGKKADEFRTSLDFRPARGETQLIADLEARAEMLTRIPASHQEPLQILECADDSSLCAVEKAALIKLFLVYSLASSIPRSFILLSLSS